MPAPDVVVVDHHDSYTWNLVHLIASVTGLLPEVVQHDEVTAEEVLAHEYVVLSPGPGSPSDPHDFSVGRGVLLAGTVPVLGVCLGMQGLVTTYGGRVVQDPHSLAHGEVAHIAHDGLGVFAGLPNPFTAMRYHSLVVEETSLPSELKVTARTDEGEVMGLRHATWPLEGVQFHPESYRTEEGLALLRNFLSS